MRMPESDASSEYINTYFNTGLIEYGAHLLLQGTAHDVDGIGHELHMGAP